MAGQLITRADLTAVPGVTGTDEQLDYAARRASDAVTSGWCNPIDPAPPWVKDIAIDMAADYLANPTGATSTTRSVDDASRTVRWDGNYRPRRIASFELTDAERDKLCPKVRRGVGSIRLGVPGYRTRECR